MFVDHPASILSSDGYFNACTFYAIVARWLTLPKIGWWCWESVAIKNVPFATFSLQCFLQPSLKAFCFTLLPPVWLVLPKAEWDFSTKELQPFCCHTYCARSNLKKIIFFVVQLQFWEFFSAFLPFLWPLVSWAFSFVQQYKFFHYFFFIGFITFSLSLSSLFLYSIFFKGFFFFQVISFVFFC